MWNTQEHAIAETRVQLNHYGVKLFAKDKNLFARTTNICRCYDKNHIKTNVPVYFRHICLPNRASGFLVHPYGKKSDRFELFL